MYIKIKDGQGHRGQHAAELQLKTKQESMTLPPGTSSIGGKIV